MFADDWRGTIDVVKTGMLASTQTIHAVADALAARAGQYYGQLVVDPVMVATTGAELLPREAVQALRERMVPLATVVTPNVPEARMLLGSEEEDEEEVRGVEDLEKLGTRLVALGAEWVLVKGGHVPMRRRDLRTARGDEEREVVVDVLVGQGGEFVERFVNLWRDSHDTHGTGCSLACTSLPIFPSHWTSKKHQADNRDLQRPFRRIWQKDGRCHRLYVLHVVISRRVSGLHLVLEREVGR